MIRVAICNRVREQCQVVEKEVQSYFKGNGEDVSCTIYTNTFQLLGDMEKEISIDIILLDIGVDGVSGLDAVREMRNHKWKSEIIFLADTPKLAVEAFALKAAYYLTKPFTQKNLKKALDAAMARIKQYHSRKMIFHLVGNAIQVEEVHHIVCLESNGHIQTVYLADGSSLQVRQSLANLQYELEKMAPGQFVSPSKGYLVNQNAIHVIKSDYIELKGKTIPLVKRKYRLFLQNYLQFIFEGNN